MYSATVLVTVSNFKTMAEGKIEANLGAPEDISATPSTNPPVFSGDGQSITITVPAGYEGSVQLLYQCPQPEYVLLGVAFKNPNGGVGQEEFRSIELARDPYSSQLIVTDECTDQCYGVDFKYIILVQEVASAKVGYIDPEIETQTNEE